MRTTIVLISAFLFGFTGAFLNGPERTKKVNVILNKGVDRNPIVSKDIPEGTSYCSLFLNEFGGVCRNEFQEMSSGDLKEVVRANLALNDKLFIRLEATAPGKTNLKELSKAIQSVEETIKGLREKYEVTVLLEISPTVGPKQREQQPKMKLTR